jgi:branched-chain amino acid transport system ATP-binding protein
VATTAARRTATTNNEELIRSFQVVRVFEHMAIRENLRTAIWTLGGARGIDDEDAAVEDVYGIFEKLTDRRNASVENPRGGQAKMVFIREINEMDIAVLIAESNVQHVPVAVDRL